MAFCNRVQFPTEVVTNVIILAKNFMIEHNICTQCLDSLSMTSLCIDNTTIQAVGIVLPTSQGARWCSVEIL